ncbi:hypothetical protein [Parapedomonas caeni]
MKAFVTLIRSEFIEHRGGQFWTPMVVGALLLLLVVVGTFLNGSAVISLEVNDSGGVQIRTVGDIYDAVRAEKGETKAAPILQAMAYGSAYFYLLPATLIALIVSFFMLLSSMNAERVDRSILFWKSMPVSDFKVVLAKFVAATFGTLLIAVTISIAVTLIAMALASVGGPFRASPEWQLVTSLPVLLGTFATLMTACVFYVGWAAPVYGWIMLASAWAPRSALLYVVIPPVALAIFEALTFHSDYLWQEIASRLGFESLGLGFALGEQVLERAALAELLQGQVGQMAASTISLRFVAGLAVAALFLWAASEVRRRRSV